VFVLIGCSDDDSNSGVFKQTIDFRAT